MWGNKRRKTMESNFQNQSKENMFNFPTNTETMQEGDCHQVEYQETKYSDDQI